MWTRQQWHRFIDRPAVEWTIFVVGVILMLLSPLAGILPGPGGIFVFAIGLAMVLKTSMWAKRHYVRFKAKRPKVGRWADWGLRRESAKRREAIAKEKKLERQRQIAGVPEGTVAKKVRTTSEPDPVTNSSNKPKTAAQLAREMDSRLRDGSGN